MKFIIGEKINMTQLWQDENKIAVTKIKVAPCRVVQVKTKERDGYEAVQLGTVERKAKNIAKPQLGHCKDLGNFRYLREFRLDKIKSQDSKPELQVGDTIDAGTFVPGDAVQITAFSRGRGFQGVVKRHGFHGQDKGHGNKDQLRMSGSIGAGGPAHVFKGIRMGGRMGNEQVTIKNLRVVEVDAANGFIYINCGVPGGRHSLVLVSGPGELTLVKPAGVDKIEEAPAEEVKTEETPVEETPVVETVAEEAKPATEEVAAEAPTEEVKEEAVQPEEAKPEETKEEAQA